MPPVIERAAQERVDRYAEIAAREGRIVAEAEPPDGDGLVLPARGRRRPAAGLARARARRSSARCWRSSAVRDVEHACDIVDGLPFALTGGLFAAIPATVR